MKKKKVKKKIDVDYVHDEESVNSVYMFHNIKSNIHLFMNAYDFEDAMTQFDLCNFVSRKEWKIFLETGQQPT